MNENLYKWIYSLSSQIKYQQANKVHLEYIYLNIFK